MRMSKLVGRRIKETPRDAVTDSHIFLIRGGYIRPVSSGIYSLLPLAKRIIKKIEAIIRDEMDKIDGQEVLLPVVLPRELWEESGRYEGVGPELLRFQDRNNKDMLLAMTHEEAVCHLCRTEINSYKQLPAMMYQIQTKYRDEARPRAGLIRVREFTMKDAYSFHSSQECLEDYYSRCHEAYVRIFDRLGMKDVLSIESDSGMMGGAVAHEFMAIADCGEDTIFVNEDGSYQANREVAAHGIKFEKEKELDLEKVHTPEMKSIEDVSTFLQTDPAHTGKAVFYMAEKQLVFVVIRGDFDVNETKLRNYLKAAELRFATDDEIAAVGAVPGYASVIDIDTENVRLIFDPSAKESSNLVVGANETDYHYKNFNFDRDMGELMEKVETVDIANARVGDPDPVHGKPLIEKRGIEVGNIFQLGTKYSHAMNCQFLDVNGKSNDMIMGCYGIGVGRSMASVIEQSHDEYGPIWPSSIAPYEVHICALNYNKEEVKAETDKLYDALIERGIEAILDDRNEKAGFMFNDADLIGVPLRLIISPRNLKEGVIEVKTRDGKIQEKVSNCEILSYIESFIKN
ncbi:MAG: proline--tRNA ligase [Lentisphaeria bacterium]|nr:proline--tRNA ligase [Lentisphaeria bacterium]NQZ71387.1 proline--tRNA ligase [Lentisphaeria bacterium]